jgi:hypothetical protein
MVFKWRKLITHHKRDKVSLRTQNNTRRRTPFRLFEAPQKRKINSNKVIIRVNGKIYRRMTPPLMREAKTKMYIYYTTIERNLPPLKETARYLGELLTGPVNLLEVLSGRSITKITKHRR